MKKIALIGLGLAAIGLSACGGPYYDRYDRYGYDGPRSHYGAYGDRDRDGVPNRYDRDRDNDGVPNYEDRRPNNPYRD